MTGCRRERRNNGEQGGEGSRNEGEGKERERERKKDSPRSDNELGPRQPASVYVIFLFPPFSGLFNARRSAHLRFRSRHGLLRTRSAAVGNCGERGWWARKRGEGGGEEERAGPRAATNAGNSGGDRDGREEKARATIRPQELRCGSWYEPSTRYSPGSEFVVATNQISREDRRAKGGWKDRCKTRDKSGLAR